MLRSIVAVDKPTGVQHLPIFVNIKKGQSLNLVKSLFLLA